MDFDLHTPDLSPLNSTQSLWTNESIQPADDTEIGDCAPPSAVTGQLLNSDGLLRAASPDLLQECVQRTLVEDPAAGPSFAPYEVPTDLKRETDHSYTLLTSPGPARSLVNIDAQWLPTSPSIEAAQQPTLTCTVENIEGCCIFSQHNSLHHVVNSGKFSFTATVKSKLNSKYIILKLLSTVFFRLS